MPAAHAAAERGRWPKRRDLAVEAIVGEGWGRHNEPGCGLRRPPEPCVVHVSSGAILREAPAQEDSARADPLRGRSAGSALMREFSAGAKGVGSPARVRGGYGAFTRVRNGFCKDTPSEPSMAQHDGVGSEGLLLALFGPWPNFRFRGASGPYTSVLKDRGSARRRHSQAGAAKATTEPHRLAATDCSDLPQKPWPF
jgi:hypothetical protein